MQAIVLMEDGVTTCNHVRCIPKMDMSPLISIRRLFSCHSKTGTRQEHRLYSIRCSCVQCQASANPVLRSSGNAHQHANVGLWPGFPHETSDEPAYQHERHPSWLLSSHPLETACVAVWTLLIRLGEGAFPYAEAGLSIEGSHGFLASTCHLNIAALLLSVPHHTMTLPG